MAESILRSLHVFGFSPMQEQVVLSSVLTGENMLMIGATGMSKTRLAAKIARAIGSVVPGFTFGRFSAPNDNFDDMVGYVNVKKMSDEGVIEYIPTPTTIWDKAFVFVDEINRKRSATAAKWFTVLDERQLCGYQMACKILWAAMNPSNFAGTSSLNEGEISRMASFLYPPEFVNLSEEDRVAVVRTGTIEQSPGLKIWDPTATVDEDAVDYQAVGERIVALLLRAAQWRNALSDKDSSIDKFVALYLSTLAKTFAEKEVEVKNMIDGRRAGALRRHMVAMRAISLARAELEGQPVPHLQKDGLMAVLSGLPMGVNDAGGKSAEIEAICSSVFKSLQSLLAEEMSDGSWTLCRELLSSNDPVRQIEILLTGDLNSFVKSAFWEHLRRRVDSSGFHGITSLSLNPSTMSVMGRIAVMIELEKPGTIPPTAMAAISGLISNSVDDLLRKKGKDDAGNEALDCVAEWNQIISNYVTANDFPGSIGTKIRKKYPSLLSAVEQVLVSHENRKRPATFASLSGVESASEAPILS